MRQELLLDVALLVSPLEHDGYLTSHRLRDQGPTAVHGPEIAHRDLGLALREQRHVALHHHCNGVEVARPRRALPRNRVDHPWVLHVPRVIRVVARLFDVAQRAAPVVVSVVAVAILGAAARHCAVVTRRGNTLAAPDGTTNGTVVVVVCAHVRSVVSLVALPALPSRLHHDLAGPVAARVIQ